jgi:hypothetical protein
MKKLMVGAGVLIIGVCGFLTYRNLLNLNKQKTSSIFQGNFSNEFYVVFKAGISRKDAESILKLNNVKTFNLRSLPPDWYKFKLDESRLCESLRRIYDIRDTFSIPAINWEQNEGDLSKLDNINCPSVPSSFIAQNGAVQHSNTFMVTFYQNKDKLGEVLKGLGAYNISSGPKSDLEKEKTYYVTFPNGQANQNFEYVKKNANVKMAGNVPRMPTRQ